MAMNLSKALRPLLGRHRAPAADRASRAVKRILIASASVGMGHVSAGRNLEAEYARCGQPLEVRHLDILEYFSPPAQLAYRDAYFRLVADHAPVVRLLYDMTDQPFPKNLARILLHPRNGHRFCEEVAAYDPDLVVTTHFTPAMLISRMIRKQQLQARLATVVTDFDVHGLWLQNQLDKFFVATEESRQYLLALGVAPEHVCASGIPTNPIYGEERSRESCAAAFGLDPSLQTVLISAGGLGIGNLLPLIPILNRIQLPVQVLVMCGKSAELKAQVDGAIAGLGGGPVRFHTFGFTTEMDRFMSCSDLIFGKPGGLTTWESFRKKLAWAIHNPIPGQEERNMLRILEGGAGISCQNPLTIPYKLECLLGDPERLARMRECSGQLARPDAAGLIVQESLGLIAAGG